ncbi:MAG: hypothetical protein Q9183_004000, partial [Haloplaca sp. 2 TL-2023]
FREYPIRRKWSTPEDEFQWMYSDTEITKQRLQNWLFFGPLQVYLGHHFAKKDFITYSHSTDTWLVDTTLLPARCSDVVRYIKNDKELARIGSRSRRELRERWDAAFYPAKLHYEVLSGRRDLNADEPLILIAATVPVVLQSLRRLAEDVFFNDENEVIMVKDITPANSSLFRMLDANWCFSQISNIHRLYSPILNHYVSALPRQHIGDHNEHCSSDKCAANNVDGATYQTKHVQRTCRCPLAGPDPCELAKLVQENRIPLVELRVVSGKPELRLVAADLDTQYASLSHVWAGGLGNFKDNKLPECQLRRLHGLLTGLDNFRPPIPGVPLYEFTYHLREKIVTLQEKSNILPRIKAGLSTNVGELRRVLRRRSSRLANQSSRPVRFWMDTLCIPVHPEYKDLRKKAIDNMAVIYAAAERCLVLDPELQNISMKGLSTLQVNAHVLCSVWLTRSWTFQEARLSRAWFAQFADGIYNPNSVANASLHYRMCSPWNVFRSDERKLASEMISWYHDMAPVRQTKMILNQQRRVLLDAAWTFIFVWNQLASRSTSKKEDVHGILANTLDLSAKEVLDLPPQSRMKAILKAQEMIPAALMYNSAGKIQDGLSRWVPMYAEETFLNGRVGVLEPSQEGFFLDRVKGNPVGFFADPSLPRTDKVKIVCPSLSQPLWITLRQEPNGPPSSWTAPVEAMAVLYLVSEFQESLVDQGVIRSSDGARFALRKVDGETLHLVFEYAFLYSHHRKFGHEDDYQHVQAVRTKPGAIFHVDCDIDHPRADLSSWPKLSTHRDTSSELSSHGKYLYINSLVFLLAVIWLPLFIVGAFASRPRSLVIPSVILVCRYVALVYECLALREWINEHAYRAWVKTFDDTKSLRRESRKAQYKWSYGIGARIK